MSDVEYEVLKQAVKAILTDLYSKKAGERSVDAHKALQEQAYKLRQVGDDTSLKIADELDSLQPPQCSIFAPL